MVKGTGCVSAQLTSGRSGATARRLWRPRRAKHPRPPARPLHRAARLRPTARPAPPNSPNPISSLALEPLDARDCTVTSPNHGTQDPVKDRQVPVRHGRVRVREPPPETKHRTRSGTFNRGAKANRPTMNLVILSARETDHSRTPPPPNQTLRSGRAASTLRSRATAEDGLRRGSGAGAPDALPNPGRAALRRGLPQTTFTPVWILPALLLAFTAHSQTVSTRSEP